MTPHTAVKIYQYTEGASSHNLCTTPYHILEENNFHFKYPFNVASLSCKQSAAKDTIAFLANITIYSG